MQSLEVESTKLEIFKFDIFFKNGLIMNDIVA